MQPIAQKAMSPEIINNINDAGVIAVIVIHDINHAVPLAHALLEGGVNTVELTLRTPVALDAAKVIKKEVPEISLGFGTVLTTDQVSAVVDVGADFAVAPGCNPRVIKEAEKQGLSFAPGIMTPSDIETAVELGCRILKFFPAQTSGGLKHLQSMAAPYQYLNLKFIPLGGLTLNNAEEYLRSPLVTAIGGSWIAKSHLIQNQDWKTITSNAIEIKSVINQLRNSQ